MFYLPSFGGRTKNLNKIYGINARANACPAENHSPGDKLAMELDNKCLKYERLTSIKVVRDNNLNLHRYFF